MNRKTTKEKEKIGIIRGQDRGRKGGVRG